MKRVTVLTAQAWVGKVKVTVETVTEKYDLTRDEHDNKHNSLIEQVFQALVSKGAYAHKIKTR